MFLPVGDSPNPKGVAWVTWSLIGINVAVYLMMLPLASRPADPRDPAAQAYVAVLAEERGVDARGRISAYDAVVFRYGVKPRFPNPLDFLTSMFLHGGLLHLAGNMLFLWIYGDNVEDRLGPVLFLVAYLGTGVLAGLGDTLLRVGSAVPSVGASGAISGVLGMYFVWFPRNTVRVFVFLFPLFMQTIELRARIVLGAYVVIDNLLPLIFGAGSGVAYGAHLGGFIGGLAAAWVWDRARLVRPEKELRGARRDSRPVSVPRPANERRAALVAALDEGRLPDALRLFVEAPHGARRAEIGLDDALRLARDLERAGHPRAALAVYQRSLEDHPRDPEASAAHLGAARVLAAGLNMPSAAYQHLHAALSAASSADEIREARDLLDAIRARTSSVPRRWQRP